MIQGLWTKSEFQANTRSQSVFGRRKKALRAIEVALDQGHAAPSTEAGNWLYVIERTCANWIDSHPYTSAIPVQGKKTSNRRKGIETLLGQIQTIYKTRYGATPEQDQRRQQVTSQYETSAKDLNIAPGDKDPRTMKGRAAFHQELLEKTAARAEALGHEKGDLNTEQIGYLAAKAVLKVDSVIDKKKQSACRVEALRVLSAMLGKNRELATRFEATGIEVVVVPANRPMTDLPEFASLKDVAINQDGGTPRLWNETRGVGGLSVGGKMYVAVTEENLLGTGVGPAVAAVGGGCYAARYSTTSHEFAHGIHMSAAMSAEHKATIRASFNRRKGVRIDAANNRIIIDDASVAATQQSLDKVFSREWVDGPRRKLAQLPAPKLYFVWKGPGYVMNPPPADRHFQYSSLFELQDCYAAFDEREYFAQSANAYLGANGGNDPYTGRPRHNGHQWITANESPEMVRLLNDLFSAGSTHAYGRAQADGTNVDDGVDELTVADYIKMRVAKIKTQKTLKTAMTSRRAAMGYDD
ncbi:MAG: hypothetical protein DHS20C21_24750 [Gemmatimonadota bacterium]|nr:MAG: hypothetical protein DHS20C21_24750 [Gemmatimonadota bacterium]